MIRQKVMLLCSLFFLCTLFPVPCNLSPVTCSLSYAAVPRLINYQGRLTDKANKPLDGSYKLTFTIYNTETGPGTMTPWVEVHPNVSVQKGIFNIMLGSITDLNLAFDQPYFLEIKVGEDEPMKPRQRITSAGYAIRAEAAEKAGEANNATTVAGVGVNATPAPNKILPLDANAKLPPAVLKVYDSGWFSWSAGNSYSRTHNLGTTVVLTMIYVAQNSDGSGWNGIAPLSAVNMGDYYWREGVYSVTPTTITYRVSDQICTVDNTGGAPIRHTSGYMRIVMLALE